jgi:glycosyltransferase involved in cell wall biosynthesis
MSAIHRARVSVVIPCYNAGDYLEEAVQSALAQTYRDLEVIVVDDGSTDERTKEILAARSWPRTTVIRQPNGGPSAARNRAVMEASGEFILPLDADDIIDQTYVEKAVAILQALPDVGIVYCKANKFGVEQGAWQLPGYTLNELVIDNVIFCTSLYRKEDWSRVGGYNETLRHGMEDYEFWIKLVHLGREVFQIDEPLFFYRIQKASRTTGFMASNATVVSTYAEIFRANQDFFAKHAETLYQHRFRSNDELNYWRHRYGRLDAFLNHHPLIKRIARKLGGFV